MQKTPDDRTIIYSVDVSDDLQFSPEIKTTDSVSLPHAFDSMLRSAQKSDTFCSEVNYYITHNCFSDSLPVHPAPQTKQKSGISFPWTGAQVRRTVLVHGPHACSSGGGRGGGACLFGFDCLWITIVFVGVLDPRTLLQKRSLDYTLAPLSSFS